LGVLIAVKQSRCKNKALQGNYEFLRKALLLTKYQMKKYELLPVIFATTYTISATCLPERPSTFVVLNQTGL